MRPTTEHEKAKCIDYSGLYHELEHIFSILPSSFSQGFKKLVATTLNPEYAMKPPVWMATLFPSTTDSTQQRWDQPLWLAFEQIGMIERYESLISSVCYEHIESHILKECSRVWDQPSLSLMRTWMTDQIVPWNSGTTPP